MKEPVSSISNIAFIVSGIILWNGVTIPLIGLGLASFWYHATKSRQARLWDVRMIYAVFNFAMAHLLSGFGHSEIIYLYAIFATAIMWLVTDRMNSFRVIPVQFFACVLIVYLAGGSLWFVSVFVIALIFNLPFILNWQRTKGLLTDLLHGGWHFGAAYGFYLLINSL